MNQLTTVKWMPIQPLDPSSIDTNGRLAGLEALREIWLQQVRQTSEKEFVRRRQRSLRRLAVETGIIERLYEIDWGLTLTLVAEGFARDALERAGIGGGVDDWTLATLNAQRESLEMVVDFVRCDRRLSSSFIKELHQAITRTQPHYDAVDSLGQVVRRELPRGTWKQWPNHVVRENGSILEYCPPEHVVSEIDNLSLWFEEVESSPIHPLIRAAWLHHRFVQIHPFADGNGRVARCLTLLVMQRHQYAPLVVDRHHRGAYLTALDRANDGDLNPLVQLFTSLESSALASELEQPEATPGGTSGQVAHTLAAQLAHRREQAKGAQRVAMNTRTTAVFGGVRQWMTSKHTELREVFASQGITDVTIDLFEASSDRPEFIKGAPRHLFFRRQITNSAHESGHYADFGGFVGLLTLRIKLEGLHLSYAASLHGAGINSGAMAVTSLAVIRAEGTSIDYKDVADIQTNSDAFYFTSSESMETLNRRYPDLIELLDGGLTVALAELMKRM